MYLVLQIWRWINENSKVCYEKTQKQCVVSENSCLKNFVNYQEKHPSEISLLNKVAGYVTLTGKNFLGNLWNLWNSFHKKHLWMPATAISYHWKMLQPKWFFRKYCIWFFYEWECFDIQWHLFWGIKCTTGVQELNVWIRHVVIF